MGEEGVVGSMPLAVATGGGGSWSHRIHWKLRDGRCYLLPGLLAPVLFRSEPQLTGWGRPHSGWVCSQIHLFGESLPTCPVVFP